MGQVIVQLPITTGNLHEIKENKMAKIERCYGISTGTGYLVGAGGTGKTEELDNLVQAAAEKLCELFNVDITIRFNTNRKSGGAFVVDNETSSKIGITAGLRNSELQKMSREERINLTEEELDKYLEQKDCIVISTCLAKDFLKEESPFICLDSEFRDVNSLEEAVEWIKTGTNSAMRKYILELKKDSE